MTKCKSAWFMWAIAVAFFSFQFVLRLFPGLIIPELMGKFQIDASAFGVLSSVYYLGYAGLQIPVGVLLDKYSPRYVISISALLCGLGTLTFVYSNSWSLILLGRFLIGAGSATGFLGAAKIVRSFFPENRFGMMIGVSCTFGLMGALYGGRPVSLLIDQMGWKQVLIILAGVSFALSAMTFTFFPRQQKALEQGAPDSVPLLASISTILTNRKIVWIGLAGALMVGPLEGFADVWGVSYLVNVYHFSKADASLATSCIYFGMLFGGPILSFIAQRLNSYYSLNALCGLLMAGVFGILLTTHVFHTKEILMAAMTLTGVLSCYQVVVFALACKLAPPHLSGLVTSVTNCINMSAGCLLHFCMGWVMDHHWAGDFENGIKIYNMTSYTNAIWVIPVALVFGFVGFLLLRENEPLKSRSL